MTHVVKPPFSRQLARMTCSLPRMDGLGVDHSLGLPSWVRTFSHSMGPPIYMPLGAIYGARRRG